VTDLIAATGTGVARLSEDDGGWLVAAGSGIAGAGCVAADATGEVVYAGGRGSGVWKSEDLGTTWNRLAFPQPDVFSLAVSRADGALYAGCEPSALYRSRDAGATWTELQSLKRIPSAPTWSFPPRPWTSHVRWVAPSPHDAARLLVGIELGGLMVSEDGGESWHDHRPGAQRDVHSLAWHPAVPGRAYEAGGGGTAWSRDGGLMWRPADEGRDRHYAWAVAVDPDDPDVWFVSASPGPRQAHRVGQANACLYRWRGEGPWEALDDGLPSPLEAMPYALVAAAGRLFAGLADGTLYTSDDRGDSWRRAELIGDPLPAIVALAATAETRRPA
jgi:photosystem II stability/assembly factor-like uncharacterized protein